MLVSLQLYILGVLLSVVAFLSLPLFNTAKERVTKLLHGVAFARHVLLVVGSVFAYTLIADGRQFLWHKNKVDSAPDATAADRAAASAALLDFLVSGMNIVMLLLIARINGMVAQINKLSRNLDALQRQAKNLSQFSLSQHARQEETEKAASAASAAAAAAAASAGKAKAAGAAADEPDATVQASEDVADAPGTTSSPRRRRARRDE